MNPMLLAMLVGGGLGYGGMSLINSTSLSTTSTPATNALTPITAGTSADYFENQLLGRVEAGVPTVVNNTPSTPQGPDQSAINRSIYASALAGGISSALSASAQSDVYGYQADSYRAQARTAALNVQSAKRNLYSVAQNYEYQAMLQGLQDRRTIGEGRNRAARSGTRMGVGSTAEVLASQQMNATANQYAINRSRTSAMNDARTAIANARAQQYIAEGNARAADIMGDASNPFLSFITGATMAFAMSDMSWQGQGMKTPTTGGGWGFI